MPTPAPYLVQRGHVWWWRRRIPVAPCGEFSPISLRQKDGAGRARRPRTIAVSLRTPCRHEARRRGALLTAIFEAEVGSWGHIVTMDALQDREDRLLALVAEQSRQFAQLSAQFAAQNTQLTGMIGTLVSALERRSEPAAAVGATAPTAAPSPRAAALAGVDAVMDAPPAPPAAPSAPPHAVAATAGDAGAAQAPAPAPSPVRPRARPAASPAPTSSALASPAPTSPALSLSRPAGPVADAQPTPPAPAPAPIRSAIALERARGKRNKAAARIAHAAKREAKSQTLQALGPDALFKTVADHYVEVRSRDAADWRKNSAPNVLAAVRAFLGLEGDLPCKACDAERFLDFFDGYRRLPKNWGKSGTSPLEDIEKADAREAQALADVERLKASGASTGDVDTALATARVQRVSPATVYRVMQDMQRIVHFGVELGAFTRNEMAPVIWSKKKLTEIGREVADRPRLAWGDRVGALFSSKAFTQPIGDVGEPLFWLPLIGHCAGLRMEEAAQLKTVDIDTVRGVPVILVQRGPGQHLKNDSARRVVPIHDALLELGLLTLVEQRRREGQEWLFPNIERGRTKGRKSETFSKDFTQYRREVGLYDPQRDFHSLRTGFNVAMKRGGVGLEVRKRLLGHRLTDVTEAHYDPEGSPIDAFRAAVNLVALDVSAIRRPFGDALRNRSRRGTLRVVN